MFDARRDEDLPDDSLDDLVDRLDDGLRTCGCGRQRRDFGRYMHGLRQRHLDRHRRGDDMLGGDDCLLFSAFIPHLTSRDIGFSRSLRLDGSRRRHRLMRGWLCYCLGNDRILRNNRSGGGRSRWFCRRRNRRNLGLHNSLCNGLFTGRNDSFANENIVGCEHRPLNYWPFYCLGNGRCNDMLFDGNVNRLLNRSSNRLVNCNVNGLLDWINNELFNCYNRLVDCYNNRFLTRNDNRLLDCYNNRLLDRNDNRFLDRSGNRFINR